MSALTNAAETALLNLIFKNIPWANIGDAIGLRGSSADGVFYLSLHTADPGEGGSQTSSEISYTGYARKSVARGAGFTVSGDNVSNAAEILFDEMTAGAGGTATYVGLGTDSSGAGNLVARAAVTSPAGGLAISAGITPRIAAGVLDYNAA